MLEAGELIGKRLMSEGDVSSLASLTSEYTAEQRGSQVANEADCAEDAGAVQRYSGAHQQVPAIGCEGVGLVLEPTGVVAVVGVGGGEVVPAGALGDLGGDASAELSTGGGGDGLLDGGVYDVAEEGAR
jgi:hypothetical protein